jgi:NAD-dependent deacetylase
MREFNEALVPEQCNHYFQRNRRTVNSTETITRPIDQIVDLLREARSLLFITGAGISADSGLPTYRGVGGLYNATSTEEGLPIEELLSGRTMRQRPALTWKYLGQVEQACRGARFNRGHEVIAAMESHFDRVWTLTQNVDGFHRQAGSRNVVDIHGDLHHLFCPSCGFARTVTDYSTIAIPPQCPNCPALLRPDVVLFGEALASDKLSRLYTELERGFDLVFSVGTTSVFPYISEPVERAHQLGKPTVEINPGLTEVSHLVTIRLSLGAAAALDAIWKRYQARRECRS